MLQNRGISANLFVPIYPFKFFLLWELIASFHFIIQGLYVIDQILLLLCIVLMLLSLCAIIMTILYCGLDRYKHNDTEQCIYHRIIVSEVIGYQYKCLAVRFDTGQSEGWTCDCLTNQRTRCVSPSRDDNNGWERRVPPLRCHNRGDTFQDQDKCIYTLYTLWLRLSTSSSRFSNNRCSIIEIVSFCIKQSGLMIESTETEGDLSSLKGPRPLWTRN